MIKFLGDEAQIGHTYQNRSQLTTGYEGDQDILNNIYDLEGNNIEWTAQAYYKGSRILRGGKYESASDNKYYPASHETDSGSHYARKHYTSRSTLYIML